MAQPSLDKKLRVLQKFFDFNKVLNLGTDQNSIKSYYQTNQHAYSIFHSLTNQVHMGISRDGKFKVNDLLEAARIVESFMEQRDVSNVLELATGRGATSAYLAKRHLAIKFHGIDLSPAQLSFAYKQAKSNVNYLPTQGDYHDLGYFGAESMDIVFAIEAVCYSENKDKIFKEVNRVLRPNGLFILFDGYGAEDRARLSKNQQLAMQLVEKGMAVSEFEAYSKVKSVANRNQFQLIQEEDLSEYIIPTLTRFETTASFFFNVPLLGKLLVKLFPLEFTANAISGYLFPDIIRGHIGYYHLTVFQKQ